MAAAAVRRAAGRAELVAGRGHRVHAQALGELTLFLPAGAPLDNNICERALKKAILHRKNSLFYKSEHGAHVGDLFMSLIHTCELCGANPFDYLTELQRHAAELQPTPRTGCPGTTGRRSRGMSAFTPVATAR